MYSRVCECRRLSLVESRVLWTRAVPLLYQSIKKLFFFDFSKKILLEREAREEPARRAVARRSVARRALAGRAYYVCKCSYVPKESGSTASDFTTKGIDIVAMSDNDVITCGTKQLIFLDNIPTSP